MRRVHVYISGYVQGVFFRAYVREHAKRLSIKGWVRNLLDGRVEAVFEGKPEDIDKMVEFCKKGPPGAWVKDIQLIEEEYLGEFNQFEIRYF